MCICLEQVVNALKKLWFPSWVCKGTIRRRCNEHCE